MRTLELTILLLIIIRNISGNSNILIVSKDILLEQPNEFRSVKFLQFSGFPPRRASCTPHRLHLLSLYSKTRSSIQLLPTIIFVQIQSVYRFGKQFRRIGMRPDGHGFYHLLLSCQLRLPEKGILQKKLIQEKAKLRQNKNKICDQPISRKDISYLFIIFVNIFVMPRSFAIKYVYF